MAPIGCSETSVTIYKSAVRNIPEERGSDVILTRIVAECMAQGMSGQGTFMSFRLIATWSARGEVKTRHGRGWSCDSVNTVTCKVKLCNMTTGHVPAESILNAMPLNYRRISVFRNMKFLQRWCYRWLFEKKKKKVMPPLFNGQEVLEEKLFYES